ncbi:MAG TPA: zf-HC2 domain-containing protein [Terriglobales bacterium]|nr:zf-HC2 domain-containing protein [Terriglobales bacterium]
MQGEFQNGFKCADFDALLAEAIDGTLTGTQLMRFEAHRESCAQCSLLFTQARAGYEWLEALPEVEPPVALVKQILAATQETARAETVARHARQSWTERIRELLSAKVRPVFAAVAQPRFAMSFGMAFFSVTLMLNVTGVRLTSLKHVDLRPSSLVRGYYETTGRLVKYYENIRFVYEIETRVRELKRAATPEEKPSGTDKQQDRKEQNRGNDREKKYENYSREDSQPYLATTGNGLQDVLAAVRRWS